MATSKYESIWELLSTYDFKDEIPHKFHCVICKNVAIDPYASLCECRFCSSCIKDYLKDGCQSCPGSNNECLEDHLEIEVNITRDLVAIGRIGRLLVTCPNKICKERCSVGTMGDHMRVCEMSSTKCPYESIGCEVRQISKNNVKNHYENEWLIHTQLLIEAIDSFKNEFNEIKNSMENKDEQIIEFNKKFEENVSAIMEMKRKIDEQRREIDVLKDKDGKRENELEVMRKDLRMKEIQRSTMKKELEKIKKHILEMDVRGEVRGQNKSLKEKQESIVREMASVNVKISDCQIYDESEFLWRVDNFSEMTIIEMKQQIDDQSTEIDKLKDKDGRRENELEVMRKDLRIKEIQRIMMKKELEKIKKDILEMDVRGEVRGQNKSLNDFKDKQESIVREMASVNVKLRVSQIYDEREFLWRVNKVSEVRDRRRERRVILWRYSVKFELYLWWSEEYGLDFDCRIIKGDFDDFLPWPMKHKITLSVINQASMETHRRREYSQDSPWLNKGAFDKPKDGGKNVFICADIFMTAAEVRDSPGVILNDSLIVSFNIE